MFSKLLRVSPGHDHTTTTTTIAPRRIQPPQEQPVELSCLSFALFSCLLFVSRCAGLVTRSGQACPLTRLNQLRHQNHSQFLRLFPLLSRYLTLRALLTSLMPSQHGLQLQLVSAGCGCGFLFARPGDAHDGPQ